MSRFLITWYNFIAFKKFMEDMIFRELGVRSSDGLEGRNFFLSDRKRGYSRGMCLMVIDVLQRSHCGAACLFIM